MTKRIVVDPITRIKGHLRMEADIENGVITEYAESVPPYIRSVLSGRSKMRYTSSFRRMPSR